MNPDWAAFYQSGETLIDTARYFGVAVEAVSADLQPIVRPRGTYAPWGAKATYREWLAAKRLTNPVELEPRRITSFDVASAQELHWRVQKEWKIRAEMERRLDVYFAKRAPAARVG